MNVGGKSDEIMAVCHHLAMMDVGSAVESVASMLASGRFLEHEFQKTVSGFVRAKMGSHSKQEIWRRLDNLIKAAEIVRSAVGLAEKTQQALHY